MKANKSIYAISFTLVKAFVFLIILTSCNKEYPNILKEYGEQPDYASGSSKVLYIIADGVLGKTMQDLDLPNFRVIARNSLHTYGSLADYKSNTFTKESGLANLLTGVTNDKHKVVGNDFTQANLEQYPSILSRINSKASSYTSATFTANESLSSSLFKDADKKVLAANDDEVITKTTEELLNGNSDFIVANLQEIYTVGLSNSFASDNAEYVAALKKFDQSVGALINTLKQRKTYAQENWLVIITSSIGGPVANQTQDNTRFGDNNRNTITYFYNPNFTRGLLIRPNSTEIPFDGNAVNYTYGANQVNATLADASDYSFANATDDFTINFFIKTNNTDNHNYPIILSKRTQGFSGNGWNLFLEVRDGNNKIGWNSNISGQTFGTKQINDGKWHSFTVTVNRSGSADSVKVFTDGVLNAKNPVNTNSLNNDAPLVIGKKVGDGNSNPNMLIANLQIYNKAMTEKEVAEFSGNTFIDNSHPKYNNLIGYWPGYDDVGTNKLKDLSPNKNNMVLTGNYNWVTYSDLVSYFRPPITDSFYKLVPNAVDLPFFIYQWFGMIPLESWRLDGKSWTPSLLVSAE